MTANWTPTDVICTDKYLALENGEGVAYMKTDVLVRGRSMEWRGRHHDRRPAAVWITGHSDYPITDDLLNRYRGEWERWAGVNKDTDNAAVLALPLGLTNDCDDSPRHRIFGNVQVLWEVAQMPRTTRGLAYANFDVGTYPSLRAPLLGRLKGELWVTVGSNVPTMEGRRQYLTDIRQHTFTFCPRGNGIDTHRLWETLYVGGIPIVERCRALREFEDLPICWVDRFDDVTPEFLERERGRIEGQPNWNWAKLRIGYWQERIRALAA